LSSSFDLIPSIWDSCKIISVEPTSSPNFFCVEFGEESALISRSKSSVNLSAKFGNSFSASSLYFLNSL